MTRLTPIVVFFIGLAHLTDAAAHKARIARKVMATAKAQSGELHLHVLLWQHHAGLRSKRIIAQFDLDGSKTFDQAESLLAGNALSTEVIGRFLVFLDGEAWLPRSAEAKSIRLDEKTVETAVLLTYSAPFKQSFALRFSLHPKSKQHARKLDLTTLAPLLITAGKQAASVSKSHQLTPKKTVDFEIRSDPFTWLERLQLKPF